jgi:2-polyprenyl-6-hydroxyphenyl methylase/3-demethylubiquinone-9 3-methyltransferase
MPRSSREVERVVQFDFGQNWKDFAERALTPERVARARAEFSDLLGEIPLDGAAFLDIGFGQGLSLLAAASRGSRTVGCDINPKCAEALHASAGRFPEVDLERIPIVVGSILEPRTLARLRAASPRGDGAYDIVHSWGVFHHTGDMALAVRNAASLVRKGGYLVLAIYNRHWSSPAWTAIKWLYCKSPGLVQHAMVYALAPVIWIAKLAVTRRHPAAQQRGMDFHYNVIDWVGGYPYEYASIDKFKALVQPLGFECVRAVPAEVPTGCNEFIFRRG